jgi:hypothetical protein
MRSNGWKLGLRSLAVLAACWVGCKGERAGTAESPVVPVAPELPRFSFFVTSLRAMQELSADPNGFGGDLRFGETGEGAGLRGADKICATIAKTSLAEAEQKTWRAFLSTTRGGPDGGPVHAADRIGEGPWYDRLGRLVANTKAELIQTRPETADPAIKSDLPNEDGVPNHNPDGTGEVDNHDVLTGTNSEGRLYRDDPRVTCDDWTKSEPDPADSPRVGHSWPRDFGAGFPGFGGFGDADGGTDSQAGGFPPRGRRGPGRGFPPPGVDGGVPPGPPGGGFPGVDGDPDADGGVGGFFGGGEFDPANWMSSLDEAGCGASVGIIEMGPPNKANPTVGSGGGYGGIYCFALTP